MTSIEYEGLSHGQAVTLMFVVAGAFAVRLWVAVGRATEGYSDPEDGRHVLRVAGVVMQLCLVTNGLGFLSTARIPDTFDGSPVPWGVLWDQLAVLVGTASLLELVARAVRDEAELGMEDPGKAWMRALLTITERLLPRFWWAAAGLGVVFGIASGPGVVLFLAVELLLMWVIGRFALARDPE